MTVHTIAAAIGEPARERMLYCLMDGHARTSTELAVVADVSPSTGSVHLNRLKAAGLVKVSVQGKHRYYSLDGSEVAQTLEALSVLAGTPRKEDLCPILLVDCVRPGPVMTIWLVRWVSRYMIA